jgi:PIN domain nuclease of toxin-antitoxin system
MRLLLDTHIFLWYITGDAKISQKFRDAIDDPANDAILSVVSFLEIVIKNRIGKMPLPALPDIYVPDQRIAHDIASLKVDEASVKTLAGLPSVHNDPFDRLLVAQAISAGLTIVTVDSAIKQYSVSTL